MNARRPLRARVAAVAVATLAAACADHHQDDAAAPPPAPPQPTAPAPEARPVEWVGWHSEMPFAPADFHALASGLFGDDARATGPIGERELSPGLFVGASPEPSTSDQVRVSVAFDDGTKTHRKIALAPASFEIGTLFVATVDAAVAKMQKDVAAKPGSGESFLLEYRTTSAQGGRLSLGLKGDRGAYTLVLDVSTPKTNVDPKALGTAAENTAPHDTVAGTVWFHMTKDDFAYFVDHAYGKGATGKHNFKDFVLVPFDWLRLTVEPHLDQRFVNVGFEVLDTAGKRTAFARAPASVLAGSTFQHAVLHAMDAMTAQEAKAAGSSTPWQIPFYYDAPKDGGVVQVVAQGDKGVFTVAYAVESPAHALRDVPLLEYEPVVIEPEDPNAKAACWDLGDPKIVRAPEGTLDLTFQASTVIKESKDVKGPLVATISCSVFHASDVHVDGPVPGAVSLQDFDIPNADLSGPTAPKFTTKVLPAGDYQVLCYQDLDGDKTASPGDPVTLPIGGDPVACNVNPTVVEFAILYPKP